MVTTVALKIVEGFHNGGLQKIHVVQKKKHRHVRR